jgi:hypothetical protein
MYGTGVGVDNESAPSARVVGDADLELARMHGGLDGIALSGDGQVNAASVRTGVDPARWGIEAERDRTGVGLDVQLVARGPSPWMVPARVAAVTDPPTLVRVTRPAPVWRATLLLISVTLSAPVPVDARTEDVLEESSTRYST